MRLKLVHISILLFFLTNCSQRKSEDNLENALNSTTALIEKKQLQLDIIRLEKEIFESKSKAEIGSIFKKHPYFADKFLNISQYPSDSILVNAFYQLKMNKSMDSIYRICNENYGDFYDLGMDFQNVFDQLKALDKRFKSPKIYTIITGMGNDMYVDDSIVVIGIEFFLAEKCRYKPQLPLYMLKRYRKENILPMVVSNVSTKYNKTDYLDNTLLAEMIYYGKTYYFLENLIPEIVDTMVAGYDKNVLEDVEKNEKIIWAHFIDKKLLFETKNEISNRYVGERPTTFEIGNNCPGRIGRWVGWQIVKAYAKRNPQLNLIDIMNEKDAKKILTQSKYKPNN